jgi:polar amino acid transport system substrate-binding protein
MTRRLLVLALLLVGCGGSGLRLVSSEWPPFTDEVEPRVALDIVHRGLARAGIRARTELVEPAVFIPGLEAGDFDGSAALWRSADREAYLLYSRAYLQNRIVVVSTEERHVDVEHLEALAGHRVGVVEGYAYGDAVDLAEGVELVEAADSAANLEALLAGEVDVVLEDALVVHHLYEQYGETARARLLVGSRPLAVRTLHLAVRRDHPGAEAIIAAFDAEIGHMLADGTYNEILEVSYLEADVDDDGTVEVIMSTNPGTLGEPPEVTYELMLHDEPSEGSPREAWQRGAVYVDGVRYDSWEDVPPDVRPHAPPEEADRELPRDPLVRPILGF